jgi:hypothetical protein
MSNVFSQDLALVKEIQRLTLANDSLQKEVIKPLNDNLNKINAENEIKIAKLKDQIKTIENESKNLAEATKDLKAQTIRQEDQINNLKKDKSKVERDRLIAQLDSMTKVISTFKIKIDSTQKLVLNEKQKSNKELDALRESHSKLLMIEKEKSKNEIITLIIESYNQSFDELIKSSSSQSIKRDLRIIGTNTAIQRKLDQLLIFFESETILNAKYNAENVANSKVKLSKIEQSELVISLFGKIDKYGQRNEGLVKTLDKITLDGIFEASDEDEHIKKLNITLSNLASFYRNYKFNFLDYPYLTDIILEVQKLKQKDSNADIKALKDKL